MFRTLLHCYEDTFLYRSSRGELLDLQTEVQRWTLDRYSGWHARRIDVQLTGPHDCRLWLRPSVFTEKVARPLLSD